MGRSILSVVLGVVAAVAVVMAIESLGHVVYPVPEGLDYEDVEAMTTYVDQLPVGAFVFVIAAWTFGAGIGAFVAARLAKTKAMRSGMIVGGIQLLAGLSQVLMIPHPLWFSIVALAGTLLGAGLGTTMGSPSRTKSSV